MLTIDHPPTRSGDGCVVTRGKTTSRGGSPNLDDGCMKQFDHFNLDYGHCREELHALKVLLDKFEGRELKERKHVLSFLSEHRHVAALVGHIAPNIANVDRIAYEFDFFGDYAADLALGDSRKHEYCFVEFENAAHDSNFRRSGKKSSLEWSPSFDHGYSQIIDWFWKLHDMARTSSEHARFYGLLVIGRSQGLAPIEVERLNWRRKNVLVDSTHIYCMTFDELYEDLVFKLEKYGPAAAADLKKRSLAPRLRPTTMRFKRRPRKPRFEKSEGEPDTGST